jgi:2-dehydro-3-deoxy-D-arabinonate dehydratase
MLLVSRDHRQIIAFRRPPQPRYNPAMRLGQVYDHGRVVAAIYQEDGARPIRNWTLVEVIERAEAEGLSLGEFAEREAGSVQSLDSAIVISPPEVWASGCTYETSAAFRDAEHGTREGFYAHVYRAERPEIFFKGTARHCVGHNQPIGARADSRFTAPEPELAVILGGGGRILGYTLANDVSAWDIERENPLYLPQSKTYTGCCSLGPVLVTSSDIPDPYSLEITCRIKRQGRIIFEGSTSTSRLNRKLESIVEFLRRANPVPAGTVLCTGTGIIVKEDAALAAGDEVAIECAPIGVLSNTVSVVS